MVTKTEPKLAVRTWVNMNVAVTVEAEAIAVDASTWTLCSQGKAKAIGDAVILIRTR